jgi:hypothetical protein
MLIVQLPTHPSKNQYYNILKNIFLLFLIFPEFIISFRLNYCH